MSDSNNNNPTRVLPLAGIKVLDLTRVLAGPWCTMNLADLGADVLKVERPGAGDDTRGWGPPFLKDREGHDTKESAYYLAMNRNKRSVTLDITTGDGQRIARELAAKADVLVENYKVGGLAKYGLDYAALAAINPRLIYCSITGFGQTGPWAERAGYDYIVQGLCGLMSVTGERDDLPGGGPQKVGVAATDILTGMYSTVAILAALRERDGVAHAPGSGRGQHIDMALFDVGVAFMGNLALNYLVSGRPPGRAGNAHQNIVPYQVFEVADGHIIIAVGNDAQYRAYCDVLGRMDYADDPRFMKNADRVRHRTTLVPLLAIEMKKRKLRDWIDALEARGVPCGPINNLAQAFAEPQAVARGLRIELPHTQATSVPNIASPLRLSETPPRYITAPPLLGEHTEAALKEWLNADDAQLAAWRNAKVI